MTIGSSEVILVVNQVPANLRPLYDGFLLESVWKTADGIVLTGEFGTVFYENWDRWGEDYWNARQEIRSLKLTDYPDDAYYSRFAFFAAQEELDQLRRAVQDRVDRVNGEEIAFRRQRQIDAAKTEAEKSEPGQNNKAQTNNGTPKVECGITLRPYQERAVSQLENLIRSGKRRILLVGPTGMGKMVLAGYLMGRSSSKGSPSLFIADMRELIGQCKDKLTSYGVPCGVIMAQSDGERNNALAQIASKDTLWSRAFRGDKMAAPSAKLVIPDEAHRSRSETWRKILDHYKSSVILGMTATPCRNDGKGMGGPSGYEAMLIVATYAELREAGFIVPSKVFAPTVPNLKGIKISKGDYVKDELTKRMDKVELVGDIVKDWRKRADGRLTVVFASGVMHSIHIRNQFRKFGVSAEHVDSVNTNWDERTEILERFHRGEFSVLCNFGVLTTGWDEPAVSCMICARPTKSYGLWRQMAGRVLRAYPGKTDAIILDHSGAVFRHGYPDEDVEWELSEDANINDKIKEKLAKEAKVSREPYACPKCANVYRGPECPSCGYKPTPKERAVKMVDGELKEVTRDQIRRSSTTEEKQKYWNACLGRVVGQNHKLGSAAGQYKQKFGVFPDGSILKRVPRGQRQWNMPAKEYWQAIVDHEQLGLEMPENET